MQLKALNFLLKKQKKFNLQVYILISWLQIIINDKELFIKLL